MRLERITLHGFKSFAERTEVRVLPGITCIVGPNGCGKSNLSDAVRWALGEQSAKSLRGHRMEDVIFHGSASRRPVGMAEVELLFSNDGTLPVAWSEIAVARRLYRTGESEYLLNGQPTRLRDILDLFAGTGANPRAYSVMDQDKLNHVLTARPAERRVFIEEAAGIARYKQQRSETQAKLEAARQNLLRVRDVMDEVRRQLGALERQAKKAQQYKALAEERREVAVALTAADLAALEADEARLGAEIAALRDREQAARTELARLAGQEAAHRQALQESEHRLGDLRQALQKVQAELERLLERREQMGIQLREAADEVVRLGEEARLGAERLAALDGERAAARAALADAERVVADRAAAAAALEADAARHQAELGAQRERLEALRLEQVRLAGERTELTREAGELRERQSQLQRRAERLAAERAEVEAEARRLAAARAELEAACARAESRRAALAAERARVEAALEETARRLGEAQTALAGARLALTARQSSLEALRQLERAREGYGAGVRALFGAEGPPGLLGTVADLLEVPAELERAVAAVLGERLEWVVVERFDQARQALAWLQARRAGTATFVPLDTLPPPAPPPADLGVTWLAPRLGGARPALLAYLLGRVALVEHLDRAEALWRRNGVVATYVTPAGEVLGPAGRLRGGSDGGRGEGALLARKRQIRELEEDVRRLEGEVGAAARRVATLEAEVAGLRAELPRVDEALHAVEAERVAGAKDLEQATRERERLARHAETVALEAGQVAREMAETTATLEALEARLAALQEVEQGWEATSAGLREAIEAAQARQGALQAELTACRVELASARERVEALGRELARLAELEADLRERVAQADARRAQLAERQAALARERERTDEAAREVALERDRVEAEVRAAAEAHEQLREALAAVEQQAHGLEQDLGRVVAAIHDRELAATERRVRREELLEEAHRTLGVDAATLRARHDPARDPAPLRQRLAELDERLAAVGAVNLVADEEYRELDERLTFLRTQHDDLVASIRDLEKALRGMTRTAQERFQQAFEQINRDFGRLFERLFEGGRAELRLVEPEEGDDPLETGVELMAQPRGKRLQAVTLLSGGERALTGLALLFAIFYYRPSPFCILDEVDAPLDDANIDRFLRVLRELTARTQFLVITHNRKTMEAADVLYGVTMEEPGLSTLVSVRLGA